MTFLFVLASQTNPWETRTGPCDSGGTGLNCCRVLGKSAAAAQYKLLSPETAKMLPWIQTWPNTGKYWPLTSDLTYSAFFSNMVMYVQVLLAQSIPEPLTFSAVTVSRPKQLMLDIHLSVLCRTQHWDSTNLAVSLFFFFFFSAFTHSVIELHWSGTKQILSIQQQPLVSALTAHNGLWDQALIERVISHDFLVIAFNDLILNPSRRQRQLRALSIRDGAQCLTDWDLIWPGFLKVVV